MIIFVLGGSKSGKSKVAETYAYQLSQSSGVLYYIATMKAYGTEDVKRIKNHIEDRKNYHFTTIEITKNLQEIIPNLSFEDTILLDSVTAWASNEMFVGTEFRAAISEKIAKTIKELANHVKNIVIVSDYVFSDAIQYDDYTNVYKKELGHINCEVATFSHVVIESISNHLIIHKGKEEAYYEKLICR
ncbi:MAG: bifunctional adenosylcobinamide kinase/adenosylcobinamide-phosphate guanylyltransferase, partial [Turicibacter sp.]